MKKIRFAMATARRRRCGSHRAQANTVPEHFGGPIYTSSYRPTATLGVPTRSNSVTPMPLNASG